LDATNKIRWDKLKESRLAIDPMSTTAEYALPSTTAMVLTLEEVADYLRLPLESVRRHAIQGRLPGQAIDGEWRFLRRAIDQWLGLQVANPLVVRGRITAENIQAAQSRSQDLLVLVQSWDTADQEDYQTETWNQLDQHLPRHVPTQSVP
jgi:excisionase family DNA binding protein